MLFSSKRSAPMLIGSVLLLPFACSGDEGVLEVNQDSDSFPDRFEDRNQNGQVDPGETDPNLADTDNDGILDDDEVQALACSKVHDRPFMVYDVPGADAVVAADAGVAERSTLRLADGRAPGAMFYDAGLGVAAVLVAKAPSGGASSAGLQRSFEQSNAIEPLGRIESQRTRGFQSFAGEDAEQASFRMTLKETRDAKSVAAELGRLFLRGQAYEGALPAGQDRGKNAVINLLTVYRSRGRVVLLAAVVMGDTPSEDQLFRLEEWTDGTNLARHGSFTWHVCDEFDTNKEPKADILWVVDDSCSMEDDQQAVKDAAGAMADILASADVDFRLAVTRTRSTQSNDRSREGELEGGGFTRDLDVFKSRIVVGAKGGWEPGLETGLSALRRLEPRTTALESDSPQKLREDAATIVIHMSDERDQTVECKVCGECSGHENEQFFCEEPGGEAIIEDFVAQYRSKNAVNFAIVGDFPAGCARNSDGSDVEPGQGYVEVAHQTGGQFGSICGDMAQNLEDIARAATGVASAYQLSHVPASATLKVAVGPPGQGRVISRSRQHGFDYDPASNKVIFYGDARPKLGDEVAIGYRRWDWAGNPDTPSHECDSCGDYLVCDPALDVPECVPLCGEAMCEEGQACLPHTGSCGDPSDLPADNPCGCGAGLVCDAASELCEVPCEEKGCSGNESCNTVTHLCEEVTL